MNFIFVIIFSLISPASFAAITSDNTSTITKPEITQEATLGPQQLITAIQEKQIELQKQEEKQRRALTALYEVERKVKKTVLEKSRVQNEIEQINWSLQTSEIRIQELQKQVFERKKDLVRRVRVFSKISASDFMNVLMTSKNQSDLKKNLKLIEVLVKNDYQKLKTADLTSKQLKNEMLQLQKQKISLVQKEDQLKTSESEFQKNFNLKSNLVKNLKKSQLFNKKELFRLQSEGREMNLADLGIIDQLFKPSIFELKGQLRWPIQGSIQENFGWIRSREKMYTIKNNGLFIKAAQSSNIRPIFDGQVSAIETLDDIGTVVVIDHGEHVYSVYGVGNTPLVKAGDKVKINTTLAKASLIPQFNDTGLYFELRHYNEPQNPTAWMKGSSL